MSVLRFDLALASTGVGSSTGSGGRGTDLGSGGSGGISSTGRGTSLMRGLPSRLGAVGGWGYQASGGPPATYMLSASESLSKRLWSGCCPMAMVPRLRSLRRTFGALAPPGTPRPHLHSKSLGGSARLARARFHRQAVVMAEKANSTHRAMLRPQTALIS